MLDDISDHVEILARHLDVYEHVLLREPIGIQKLAQQSGYEIHQVRYSLRILEDHELIEPTSHGARPDKDPKAVVSELNASLSECETRFENLCFDSTSDQR